MTIIDGKLISSKVKQEIKEQVEKLPTKPKLAVIIVGENPASQIYVRNKQKACEEVGITSCVYSLAQDITTEDLLKVIKNLNEDKTVNGILVQMPLPKHINPDNVIKAISPEKDVDAFHPINVGKIVSGKSAFLPCTPAGIMRLLKEYNIDLDGKHAVVIGRSEIVGKPMAMLLLNADATVTICHSHTPNIKEICKTADIIVCAVGKAGFLTEDMVKDDTVVIDVGINRDAAGKVHGDVDFESVSEKTSFITPVPGGVGPMTVAMLLQNTLTAYFAMVSRNLTAVFAEGVIDESN